MKHSFSEKIVKRIVAGVVLVLLISLSAVVTAQEPVDQEDYDSRRTRALKFFDDHNFELALPLLRSLMKERSEDVKVLVALGFSLLTYSGAFEDPEQRRKMIVEARETLLKAKEVGGASQHALAVLEGIPEDGVMPPFSNDALVQQAMQAGEAAFVTGDYDEALAAYERAHLLDPELYEAVLYIGDMYFAKKEAGPAGAWFARAIEIDPNREVTYRYWGDALLQADAPDAALEKYLNAIVAEPYNRLSWAGLIKWAEREERDLAHPKIESPNQVSQEDEGNIKITIDSGSLDKKDGTGNWFVYEILRAARMTKDKNDPDAGDEVSALENEVMALTLVAEAVEKDLKKGEIDELDPSLATLLKIFRDGMLEPYILISRADNDVTEDYPAYREENRGKLIRYIREYIIQPKIEGAKEDEAAAGKD